MTISLDLNEKTARAVLNLRANPDFAQIMTWLREQQDAIRKLNDDEIAEHLIRQNQGAVQLLGALLNIDKSALDLLGYRPDNARSFMPPQRGSLS